jgi:tetratricopeptide (TPR) repeat protein
MRDLVRAAMLRHPAEPYLPFVMGLYAFRQTGDSALPWMGATLERAPVYGPAHLILARTVASRSPSQARAEYRLSMQQAPGLAGALWPEVARVIGGYDDALDLVPQGRAGTPVLAALVELLQSRLPATCARLDGELMSREPRDRDSALRAAASAVDDIDGPRQEPWCDGPARGDCIERALRLTSRAKALAPDACKARVLEARMQVTIGSAVLGLDALSQAADTVTDRVGCLRELVILAQRVGDERHENEGIARIASAGCTTDVACAENFAWLASVEERRGNVRRALALYKKSYALTPENDGVLLAIAGLAAATGLHAEAAEDYRELARRFPAQPHWTKMAELERAEAIRGAMKL